MSESEFAEAKLTLTLRGGLQTEIPLELIDELPVRIYLKDNEGRFLFANRACIEALAGAEGKIIGETDSSFFEPNLADKWREQERSLLGTGCKLINHNEQEEFRGGEKRWVTTSKIPIQSQGGLSFLLGITVDRTESEIEERQKNILLDQIPDLVFSKRFDEETKRFRFTYVNEAVSRLFGKPKTEIINQTDRVFIKDSRELDRLERIDHQVMAQGKSYSYQETIHGTEQADDTQQIAHRLFTVKVPLIDMTQPNQPCIGVLGVSQEFDNPQRTSEDLGFTRQALAELLERAPVGVFIKNINSEFIDFNKELMRLVGETDRNEVLGSTDMKFFAEEYAEQSRQDELKIIETKQPMQFLRLTKSLKGPQLSQRFVSKMPLLDKNGNVRGILGFSHDATITFDKFGFIKKVLSAIPEAIYVVDANGRYVLVNERFARRFKGDAPEVFDSEFLTAVDMFADCAEEMARLDRAVMESRDELKVDKRYVKMKDREGSLTFFEVTRIFFTDELTRQNYVIGLLDDRSVELTSPTLQSTAATIRDEMWKRISNPDRVYWLLCLFLTHRHGLGMNRVALWEYFNAGRAANGATTAPVLVGLTGVGQLTMAEIRDVEKADPPLELIPLFECITHYDSGLGGERSSLPAFVKSKKEVQLDRDKGIGHKLRRSDRNKVSIFDMEVDEKCPFTQSVLSGMAVQRDYTMITIPCGDHTFVVTADNVRTPDGSRPRVSEDQATHLASVAIAMREIQEQVSRTKRHPKATDYREQLITHFHYCASHASGVRTFLQKSPTKDSTIQRVVDYLSADIVRFEQLLTDLCRTESAGERPEMVSVSVREVLRIVLDEYRLRGLEPVVVESGLFELLVHCSVDLVQRVATELAENVNRHGAIAKMMIEVGVDEIDGETLIRDAGKSGYVIAGARSSDKFVRIRIRDTGTGIPGRVKSRLFDGGLDESRGRRRIGLSSAMDCMLRQGGWIQEIGTTSAVFALSFRCS